METIAVLLLLCCCCSPLAPPISSLPRCPLRVAATLNLGAHFFNHRLHSAILHQSRQHGQIAFRSTCHLLAILFHVFSNMADCLTYMLSHARCRRPELVVQVGIITIPNRKASNLYLSFSLGYQGSPQDVRQAEFVCHHPR